MGWGGGGGECQKFASVLMGSKQNKIAVVVFVPEK